MAAKKKDWSELLGSTKAVVGSADTAPDEPVEPPTTVLMHTIVGNPDNPRSEDDYSDDDPEFRELKASMEEIGQLQPLAVVSRQSFERAKPEAVAAARPKVRKLFREAEWVVITGNRRLSAARQLGWTRIDIRVQDRLGDEDGRIDEAVIIENIHRKNLAPIREAEYLQRMLERHGTQERVAERIGKSQMFVSQRLALLGLAPDLQKQVNAGTLKIKEARQIARTPDHEQQRVRLAEFRTKAAEPDSRKSSSVQNPVLKPAPGTANTGGGGAPDSSPETVENPGLNSAIKPAPADGRTSPAVTTQEAVPEPRTGPGDQDHSADKPRKLPYDDAHFCVQHLHMKMETSVFAQGGLLWMRLLRVEHPAHYKALLSTLGLSEEPSEQPRR
jgi:ParB family chromosome partitioning protein